jgi:serine/threonine protein kinase
MSAVLQAGATPDTVGRFALRRVLGQGAQATVWLAHDPRLDREVAVKLMRPGAESASDSPSVTQWLQEARSVSRLTHPNIVPVFEADVQGEQPYLVLVRRRRTVGDLRSRSAPPARARRRAADRRPRRAARRT